MTSVKQCFVMNYEQEKTHFLILIPENNKTG